MGTVKNFEDLAVWKMAREIVNCIYSEFAKCNDYSFRDQITRASVSVMNNIAEGFSRSSDAEFRYLLNISKGSAGEVKSMLYVAEDLRYSDKESALDLRNKMQRLINSIGAFMKYLKQHNA